MKLKFIFTLAAISFLLVFCSSHKQKKEKTGLEDLNLLGKVKHIEGFAYVALEKFGEIQKGNMLPYLDENTFIYSFDNNGNKTEESNYNMDKSPKRKTIFKYDDKGNKIEEIHYSQKDIDSKITFKYNLDKKLIEENSYSSIGSLEEKIIYLYDNNNLTEYTAYDSTNKIKYKRKNKFDDKGNWIESVAYNSEGNINEKFIMEYDADNNNTDFKSFNAENQPENHNQYTYDNGGNLIENILRSYNNNKDFIYASKYTDSKLTFFYDDKKNRIEERNYEDNFLSDKRTYKYEFDKEGNWIKRVSFTNDKPKYIWERKIEYY